MFADDNERTSGSLLLKIRDLKDHSAWARFVKRYEPIIFRWALQAGLSNADAEDVTQSTLTKLAQALPSFEYDPQRRFRAWLHRVMTNAITDFHRKRMTDGAVGSGSSDIQRWLEQLSAPDDRSLGSLAQELEQRFEHELTVTRRACAEVRTRVNADTWSAFVLTILENVSATDAAQQLRVKVANIYVYKQRVIKMLREVVQRLDQETAGVAP